MEKIFNKIVARLKIITYICSVVRLPWATKVEKMTHKSKYMKQIKVTIEERNKLQERFGVGANYVLQVLAFTKHGPTAERIRRAALEMGGRFVDPDFAPNCRTQYMGGMIIQTFADNVVLEIDRETGSITLSHRGEVLEKLKNESMVTWNAMAIKAAGIAESAMVAR